MSKKKNGRLYLVPTPLVEGQTHFMPEYNIEVISKCRYFILETLKTGRRHLRNLNPTLPLDECTIELLNKHTLTHELEPLLDPILGGNDLCILSDAGAPAIADPGSDLIAIAHRKNIEVIPLPGPSSIFLALMASGLNGQKFCFHGYLSRKKNQLRSDLKQIEREALKGTTQIFMETPYRNNILFESILQAMPKELHLCMASNLTSESQTIKTKSIDEWKKIAQPDLNKIPSIFLIGI